MTCFTILNWIPLSLTLCEIEMKLTIIKCSNRQKRLDSCAIRYFWYCRVHFGFLLSLTHISYIGKQAEYSFMHISVFEISFPIFIDQEIHRILLLRTILDGWWRRRSIKICAASLPSRRAINGSIRASPWKLIPRFSHFYTSHMYTSILCMAAFWEKLPTPFYKIQK